ncbi:MAG: glycosyltransferase family 2 protein [Bacteroides sp.]|nr:glycosyltransferase family 2 protein [Bacteroides sp.]
MKTLLSFVIPCYRSEFTIKKVINEIIETVAQRCDKYDYEIICVNDCSPDNVFEVLKKLCEVNSKIKVIDFAKNMGKHAALMAGYSFADGDIVVSLDDDGQCPLDKLDELLNPLYEGYDVSIARYPKKKQSWFKNFGSKINHYMACALLGKPKELQISNFLAVKRFVCIEILNYTNPYPYIGGLILRTTNKIKNVVMEERNRLNGSSGYTFIKSLKLLINGFTAFSVKPLRLATILGFFTAGVGFCFAVWIVVQKIINPEIASGYSSIMSVILFVGGVLMFLLGLIGEYVGRIYISLNKSPQYVIRKKINLEEKSLNH